MAIIIPDNALPFRESGKDTAGREAERRALNYAKILPDEYHILREHRIFPSRDKEYAGSQEDRPDFILIGPRLGIMILEVKDWNIRTNRFRWKNQYQMVKTDIATGEEVVIRNPWDQASEYRNAALELLTKRTDSLWVSSFVVYPKLSRTEFENVFTDHDVSNPQSRYLYDPDTTLFREDLQGSSIQLLNRLAQLVSKTHPKHRQTNEFLSYSQEQVETSVSLLIPSEMRVGGLPYNEGAIQKLALLDKKQQQWAFSSALDHKHYLVDVAGSGKTNVLLSRAIYWAWQHFAVGGCRILITTYSKALQGELQRIFKEKIADDPHYDYFAESIYIYDVISLMEEIVRSASPGTFATCKSQILAETSEHDYIEEKLPAECIDILKTGQWKFEPFDYLLIDEIQDFSSWFFDVVITLLKDRNNFFVVGDIGQKLFDRELEWSDHDIVIQRVALESRFLMYRNPRPIARLAWNFLLDDKFVFQELKDEGYQEQIQPKSPLQTKPVFCACSTETELLCDIAANVQDYLYTGRPEQILCVGDKNGLLSQLYIALQQNSFPVLWATDIATTSGKYMVFADFVEAKGLERDYVFILDVERLATPSNIFASDFDKRKKLMRDRIKLFVALTRAMREVRLYYIDQHHLFVKSLLQLWEKI